jgi:hypothetical protein
MALFFCFILFQIESQTFENQVALMLNIFI